MPILTELATQIAELYPLKDKTVGKRYRIVNQLAGLTELEEVGGQPRYIPTHTLKDERIWDLTG